MAKDIGGTIAIIAGLAIAGFLAYKAFGNAPSQASAMPAASNSNASNNASTLGVLSGLGSLLSSLVGATTSSISTLHTAFNSTPTSGSNSSTVASSS